MSERSPYDPFPTLVMGRKPGDPKTISWWLAERVYAVYRARFGSDQSLERLAERGGFGISELDMLLPGWRKETRCGHPAGSDTCPRCGP